MTDGAWVDRWAKNIHHGELPKPANDNSIQIFESGERVSCTSSVTSATNLAAMGERNLVSGIIYLRGGVARGPRTLTPLNQPQQAVYECLDKSLPLPSNTRGTAISHRENSSQHSRQSSCSNIGPNEKYSPLEDVKSERGASEVFNDVASARSESEALKGSEAKPQSLSDSPRSVAHTAQSETFSPLTASITTFKMSKRLLAGMNNAQVAGMMTMTATKPQETLGLLRSNQMKMSVVTKENSSSVKGEKSSTRTNAEGDDKISNYYDKWVRQSTPASKLTYRGGSRSSGQECKSPRSPKSPEMKSYDGDVDRDYNRNGMTHYNSNGSRQSRKKNHTSGLRSSERSPHSGPFALPSSSPVAADSSPGPSSASRSGAAVSHSRSSSVHEETKENKTLIDSAVPN